MDAHPVPQNVTTFEFRLIGDMTLKQFIYLASGVGFAYLLFVTIAAKFPFVAWPLIVIFSLLGVAYAFLPIQDRPLDHWTAAFFKAIYSPTKRTWKKNGKDLTNDPIFKNRLNVYLTQAYAIPHRPPAFAQASLAPTPTATPDPVPTPVMPVGPLPTPAQPQPLAPIPSPQLRMPDAPPTTAAVSSEPLPTPKELNQTVELGRQAQILQLRIIDEERKLTQIKQQATQNQNPQAVTVQFNQVFENLQKLTQEASNVKQQLASLTNQPETPPVAEPVKVVTPAIPVTPQAKPAQITLTTFPNVINGIVTDPQGNYLEGVVVVFHDKDRLPVRALKTNKLGQFTGSTPLPNGTFTIELEKDNFTFDILKIDLTGKVLPPLTVAAKTAAN